MNIILDQKLDCVKFNFQMNSFCTEMNSWFIRCNTLNLLHVQVNISNEDFNQGFVDVVPIRTFEDGQLVKPWLWAKWPFSIWPLMFLILLVVHGWQRTHRPCDLLDGQWHGGLVYPNERHYLGLDTLPRDQSQCVEELLFKVLKCKDYKLPVSV